MRYLYISQRVAKRLFSSAQNLFLASFGAGLAIGAFVMVAVIIAAWSLFAGNNIDQAKAYRHLIPLVGSDPIKKCGALNNSIPVVAHPLQTNSTITRLREPIKNSVNTSYDCAIQHHINQSTAYDLAFLEFNDDGHLIEPAQWKALEKHLKEQQNVNVLLFVHGWRNDAHIGSQDVERFHTMLSLTANYSQQENRKLSKTIGIFIGWQGRLIDEHSDSNDHERSSFRAKVLDKLAIPTILSRKPRSDAIAKPIGLKILEIENIVKGKPSDKSNNKLIIFGHSLGGNIVIKGLSDTLVERIANPLPNGNIRGVGDLVVLINPASQARNFFAIQQAAFAHKSLNPISPIVVSMTAARYMGKVIAKVDTWDKPVGEYLPLAHRVLTLFTGQPEDIQSIGNYLPMKVLQGSPSVTVSVAKLGLSHEIETNVGANITTTYQLAGATKGEFPRCPVDTPFMGWQKTAAEKHAPTYGVGWDTHVRFKSPSDKHTVTVNIRHGTVRNTCRFEKDHDANCESAAKEAGIALEPQQYVQIPNIGPAWSPVWNAAVHPDVIEEHGGYLSHTLWCVVNRFALDRPTP